jgi:hypothetical protein
MVISNEIFESYRLQKRKETKAANLLITNGYTVLDEKGKVLTKQKLGVEGSW